MEIREKRKFHRITYGFAAEIMTDGQSYEGTIENLSEKGANVISVLTDNTPQFLPGNKLDLKFRSHANKIVTLRCTVKWARKFPGHGMKYSLGLEIIDSPWKDLEGFI